MSDTIKTNIIVTGPESVGKTSLIKALSAMNDSVCVNEFARTYISGLNRPYNYSDIEFIARKQVQEFHETLKTSTGKIVYLDTYLIITKIWFVWFAGTYPDWINEEIENTSDALYLLCAPDIEWQEDDVRENGGEAREKLFNEYKAELEKFKLNYRVVSGHGKQRIHAAKSFVDEYIKLKERNI